jgi:enamine deaminase RidA (YjgF/YER057c/UK114 family)
LNGTTALRGGQDQGRADWRTCDNGASDLLVHVFGERGRHARLAVGVSSLPASLALEITAVVEIGD